MANARFLYNDVLARTSPIASSQASSAYAAINAINDWRSVPWRSATSTASPTIDFPLDTTRTLVAVVLLNVRAHTGGTVTAQYNLTFPGPGTWVPWLTFALPAARTNLLVVFGSQTMAQLRIKFTNVSGFSEYVEIGRALAFDASGSLTATLNIRNDFSTRIVDPSVAQKSEGGQTQIWQRQPALVRSFGFKNILGVQKNAILAMLDAVGERAPVVFALDPTVLDTIAWGRFTATEVPHNTMDVWHATFTHEEMI